jgi:E3 ubiquitin-protein ligase NEDD4
MRQKVVICLMIVKYAKRADEHQWILEHKYVTNFIDRSQLLTESFEYIARDNPESLRAGLFMEFKN